MKQEFEMLQQEMDDIIAINKNMPPVMLIGNVTTGMDLAEKVNSYWEGLGNKYGFKHMTVEPSSKGNLFFLAEPKPIIVPKTGIEIEMDKYDTLSKIVAQLESAYSGDSLSISGDIGLNIAFMSLKRMAKNS